MYTVPPGDADEQEKDEFNARLRDVIDGVNILYSVCDHSYWRHEC